MNRGTWQRTWTGLAAGPPGETFRIAVRSAGAMDDLEVLLAESLDPPGELPLRFFNFC